MYQKYLLMQGCLLVVRLLFLTPPLFRIIFFSQIYNLKIDIFYRFFKAHAYLKEVWCWGKGAEPSLHRKFLYFSSIMEPFGAIQRSTSRSPLIFWKAFLILFKRKNNCSFFLFLFQFFPSLFPFSLTFPHSLIILPPNLFTKKYISSYKNGISNLNNIFNYTQNQ